MKEEGKVTNGMKWPLVVLGAYFDSGCVKNRNIEENPYLVLVVLGQ